MLFSRGAASRGFGWLDVGPHSSLPHPSLHPSYAHNNAPPRRSATETHQCPTSHINVQNRRQPPKRSETVTVAPVPSMSKIFAGPLQRGALCRFAALYSSIPSPHIRTLEACAICYRPLASALLPGPSLAIATAAQNRPERDVSWAGADLRPYRPIQKDPPGWIQKPLDMPSNHSHR